MTTNFHSIKLQINIDDVLKCIVFVRGSCFLYAKYPNMTYACLAVTYTDTYTHTHTILNTELVHLDIYGLLIKQIFMTQHIFFHI